MRAQYPANIRIIRMPCTGKVDVIHMLRAFEAGVDGVYLVGCEEGNCHFLVGNLRARKRVERVKKILSSIGLESERLQMYNLSAGEGTRFVEIAKEMTEKIKNLGPSAIKLKKEKLENPA
ncbi:MAG: F420-nonreducing hydrogenase [Spirochaetes bacterium RBG_16_49_21]|nr:MAG: F420-nonreducing hydrogenase [Spirochaetes bacterium RBG_16_49_21]